MLAPVVVLTTGVHTAVTKLLPSPLPAGAGRLVKLQRLLSAARGEKSKAGCAASVSMLSLFVGINGDSACVGGVIRTARASLRKKARGEDVQECEMHALAGRVRARWGARETRRSRNA